MYEGKSHTLFAKYAVPQMIGLLFNSVYIPATSNICPTFKGVSTTIFKIISKRP